MSFIELGISSEAKAFGQVRHNQSRSCRVYQLEGFFERERSAGQAMSFESALAEATLTCDLAGEVARIGEP